MARLDCSKFLNSIVVFVLVSPLRMISSSIFIRTRSVTFGAEAVFPNSGGINERTTIMRKQKVSRPKK